MEKDELAVYYKHHGCNCAQSVLMAFQDQLPLEEAMIMKLGAPFCAGMGGMEGTCGALIAAEMVLGFQKYEGKPILKDAGFLFEAFKHACNATVCRELKGIGTGTVLCDCDTCIRNAVKAIEQ